MNQVIEETTEDGAATRHHESGAQGQGSPKDTSSGSVLADSEPDKTTQSSSSQVLFGSSDSLMEPLVKAPWLRGSSVSAGLASDLGMISLLNAPTRQTGKRSRNDSSASSDKIEAKKATRDSKSVFSTEEERESGEEN